VEFVSPELHHGFRSINVSAYPTKWATPPIPAQGQPSVDPNNLPREKWWPLWNLLMELERIDDIPRREEVKLILQRRLYMRESSMV